MYLNQKLIKKLDVLKRNIESGDFLKEACLEKDWEGWDIRISSQLNDDIKKWLDAQSTVITTLPVPITRRKVIITKFSKELSWLFYQIRDIVAEEIDVMAEYVLFYGVLAKISIDYLDKNSVSLKSDQLLYFVLDKAKGFLKG